MTNTKDVLSIVKLDETFKPFEPCFLLLFNLLETLIDYSEKLYKDNNYKDILLRYHHKNKWKFPIYHTIHSEGPPHKRTYIMGVENPNLNDYDKKKYMKGNNFKELCLSFGKGYSKKEGEQSSAKMALILHGALNNDQYEMEDIFYPEFDNMKDNNEEMDNKSIKVTNTTDNNEELSDETDSEYEND